MISCSYFIKNKCKILILYFTPDDNLLNIHAYHIIKNIEITLCNRNVVMFSCYAFSRISKRKWLHFFYYPLKVSTKITERKNIPRNASKRFKTVFLSSELRKRGICFCVTNKRGKDAFAKSSIKCNQCIPKVTLFILRSGQGKRLHQGFFHCHNKKHKTAFKYTAQSIDFVKKYGFRSSHAFISISFVLIIHCRKS